MRAPILSLAMLAALADPAQALSCLRPTVQASFAAADAAEADYVLAVGRLALFPGVRLPPPVEEGEAPVPYALRAVFEGHLATLDGFTDPARFDLMVEVDCEGPWCGAVPLGDEDLLLFVERRPVGGEVANVLVEGPCPRWALTATPEVVEGAVACLRGEGCEAP